MNTGNIIGQFCADAAQVCVADLDEVNEHNARWLEQYHPDFPKFGCTVIRDFDGDAWFEVREETYTNSYGKPAVDYVVVVCGKGINFVTGEEIVFEGKQTDEQGVTIMLVLIVACGCSLALARKR